MKAKDLMIGNWIRKGDTFGQVFDIEQRKKYAIVGVELIGKGYDVYNDDELEPIPLTPEILEKNFQEFIPGINLMYQLKGPYCASNEDGQWVFGLVKVDGENSARYPLVKISFVHQLQNSLRLCGIDKSIEL